MVRAVAAAVATSIVIIASGYIACRFGFKRQHKRKEHVFKRAMSIGAIHGGKLALERLMEYHQARADISSLNAAETELKTFLSDEHPDFNKLQKVVAKLEMSGKEGVAIEILEREIEKAKAENKPHEAYEIEMLLVEMLLYKGELKKALQCECLTGHEEITDARRPLYKAIINLALEPPKVEEASKYWQEFIEVRALLSSPSMSEDERSPNMTNFSEFSKGVKTLKEDIRKAHPVQSNLKKSIK